MINFFNRLRILLMALSLYPVGLISQTQDSIGIPLLRLKEGKNYLVYKDDVDTTSFVLSILTKHKDTIKERSLYYSNSSNIYNLKHSDGIDALFQKAIHFGTPYINSNVYILKDSNRIIDVNSKPLINLNANKYIKGTIQFDSIFLMDTSHNCKLYYFTYVGPFLSSKEHNSYIYLKDFWIIAYHYYNSNNKATYARLVSFNNIPLKFEGLKEF